MTAPIVNSSSIPLTGNAVVTQGCEPVLAESLRPGFFLIDARSQGPPTSPAAAADKDLSGTGLPLDGNVLPFLFLAPWRVQPDPTVQPPATGAEPASVSASISVTNAPADSAPLPKATPEDLLAARRPGVFEPLIATAHRVMDLLRPTQVGRLDPLCQAPTNPVPKLSADPATAASLATTVMTATTAVAEAGPGILAALMKNLTPTDSNADGAKPSPDVPAYVPLVQRTDAAAPATPVISEDLRKVIDALPKPIVIDTPTRDLKDSINRTVDVPSAALFIDGHAVRLHGPATDAPQSLKLDMPMRSPEWGQALGEKITWLVDQKFSSAEIRLNPPQLGPIEVRIAVSGDSTQISVVAHNLITRDSLEAAAPQLRAALSAHGLGNVSVDISQHSFSDRPMTQARSGGWEPWQALTNDVAPMVGTPSTRWHLPGRLDAYA
jgi:hypothetical protein